MSQFVHVTKQGAIASPSGRTALTAGPGAAGLGPSGPRRWRVRVLGPAEVAQHAASIVRLTREEQARQEGQLLRDIDIDSYLDKLLAKADLAVLEVAHRCCGFCAFYTYLPGLGTAFITLFLVSPDVRRNGMARDMLKVVAASAAQRGFHSLTLRVRDDNASAIRFYLAQGFQVVDRHERDLEMRLEMTAFGAG